ncbi:hypothetical protein VPH35_124057 [Triticum aestivum]
MSVATWSLRPSLALTAASIRASMDERQDSTPPASPRASSLFGPARSGRWLRFRSEVVRIRSTTSVCLLHGLVLLPCGISVAGANDASAGDATELKWELDEDLVRCVVFVSG